MMDRASVSIAELFPAFGEDMPSSEKGQRLVGQWKNDLNNIVSFEEYKGKKSFGVFPLKKTFEKIKSKFRKS